MSQPWINITSITLNNNLSNSLKLKSNDIVVIVGPNSSWKTQFLNDIVNYVNEKDKVLVNNISFETKWSQNDLKNFIKTNLQYKNDSYHYPVAFLNSSKNIRLNLSTYRSPPKILEMENLRLMFVDKYSTSNRLQISNSAQAITDQEIYSHAFHNLFFDKLLLEKFNKLIHKTFWKYLVFDPIWGQQFIAYTTRQKRILSKISHDKYLEWIEKVVKKNWSKTDIEWDWIKSFIWVLATLLLWKKTILCIDEPDVFLHPPQAEILWKEITKIASDKQFFLATHNASFLKWIIDAWNDRVKIIRLSRTWNKTKLKILENSSVQALLQDPLLKYSNILNWLFNDKVIICESDWDCMFYNAMFDKLKSQNPNKKYGSILFTHTSTKDRMHKIAKILKGFWVNVRVIWDIDIIRDTRWNTLKRTIESLWWDIVNISAQINYVNDNKLEKKGIKEYWKNIKKNWIHSYWKKAKWKNSIEKIIDYWNSINLYIVPEWELESFDKSILWHSTKRIINFFSKENIFEWMGKAINFIEKVVT